MFYTRLHEICKARGTTATAVVKELKLSSGNMTNWKNGRKPKTEIALKIANYLNVSVEYLMGETDYDDKRLADSSATNPDDIIKFALFGGDAEHISDEAFEDVKRFAQIVAEKERRKRENGNNTP